MKIKVDPKQVSYLLNKLTIVSKARFVHLIANAEKQTMYFRGANDSVQITTSSMPGEVDKTGACGFDYYVLKDLISSLKMHGTLTLNCTDKQISVLNSKNRSKYRVASVSADDVVVSLEEEKRLPKVTVSLDSKALENSLSCVLKAVGRNDNRWFLKGINFEYCTEPNGDATANPVMYLVATDGNRMNMKVLSVNKGFGIDKNFVIPNNGNNPFIDYLLKLTSTHSGDIEIKFSDNFAEVLTPEGDSIRTKLLDHGYVNWKQLIGYNTSKYIAVEFDRTEVQSILNRFKTLTLKFDSACRVSLEITSNGEATLSNKSLNNEVSASEELLVTNPSGLNFQIGFNSQYMLDLLAIEKSEKVVLWFSSETPADSMIRYEGNNTFGILMPIKI